MVGEGKSGIVPHPLQCLGTIRFDAAGRLLCPGEGCRGLYWHPQLEIPVIRSPAMVRNPILRAMNKQASPMLSNKSPYNAHHIAVQWWESCLSTPPCPFQWLARMTPHLPPIPSLSQFWERLGRRVWVRVNSSAAPTAG